MQWKFKTSLNTSFSFAHIIFSLSIFSAAIYLSPIDGQQIVKAMREKFDQAKYFWQIIILKEKIFVSKDVSTLDVFLTPFST